MQQILAGTCAVLMLASAPAVAQTEIKGPPDPWVHSATGVSFPARIAGFERRRVVEYSEDGRDVSVGYNLKRDGKVVVVTLYAYPAYAGVSCADTFADAQSHIANRQGARLVREGLDLAPSGSGSPVAHYARYAIPAGGMGDGSPAVTSDLYLHCPKGSGFLVKYRATGEEGFEFRPDVTRLLQAIAWPRQLRD